MNQDILVDKEPINVFDKLMEQRVIFITDFVTDKDATEIVQKLIMFGLESDKKITMFINSPGIQIRAMFMIYDMMALMKCDIEIVATGMCEGGILLLVASGAKGCRTATKHTFFQMSALGHEGEQAIMSMPEIEIEHRMFKSDNLRFIIALSEATGKTEKEIKKLLSQKKTLTVAKAIEVGLIDRAIKAVKA